MSIRKNSRHFVSFLLLDGDDLAEYLDQLLATAVPQRGKRAENKASGLCRFKAAANQTREMVSLVNKAKDLQLHSEHCYCLLFLLQFACAFHPCNYYYFFVISDVQMYLPTKLFRAPKQSLNLNDSLRPEPSQVVYTHTFILGLSKLTCY